MLSPPFGAAVASGSLRFIEVAQVCSVDGKSFEDGLDNFFCCVVDLCSEAQDGPALRTLVQQLRNERDDQELKAWRSLEARLGYDPDEAPDDLINALSEMEDRLGEHAIEEAAVAAPGALARRALQEAVEASEASPLLANLEVANAVDLRASFDSAGPWQLGEFAAHQMRNAIGMLEGPILGRAFGDILRVP